MFMKKKENREDTTLRDTGWAGNDVQEKYRNEKCNYDEAGKDMTMKSCIIINQNKGTVSFGATLQTCIISDVEKNPYYSHTLVDVHPDTAGQMKISNGDELICLNDVYAPEETHAELEDIFRCFKIDGKARMFMVVRRKCELSKARKFIKIELVLSTTHGRLNDVDGKNETKPSSDQLVVDEIMYDKWRESYIYMTTFRNFKIPGTKLFLAIKNNKVVATVFTGTEEDKTDLDPVSKKGIISLNGKICKRKCVSLDEHHNVHCVTALCDETKMNYITVNTSGIIVVSNCPQWWQVIRRGNDVAFRLGKKYLAYDQKENCIKTQRTEFLFEECSSEHCFDDLTGKKYYGQDSGYSSSNVSPFGTPSCEKYNDMLDCFNICSKLNETEDKSSKDSQAENYSNQLRKKSKQLVEGADKSIAPLQKHAPPAIVSDHQGKHVLGDEIKTWERSIREQDEPGISTLIERRELPDKDTLDLACYKFGRRSKTFTNIITFICAYIKSKSSDISNVWASYDTDECEKKGIINIVFVIITKTAVTSIGELSYTTCIRQQTEIGMESKVILESRLSDIKQRKKSDITESTLDELNSCVTKNAEYLMEKHSNINAICPNTKRSTGFGTQNHNILDVPCITIYVHMW